MKTSVKTSVKQSDFLVWRPGTMKDGICKLKQLSGVTDSFEIDEGISRIAGWPAEASASMSPRFPKDIGLADSLYGASFLVVSGAVRQFLDGEAVPRMEYLPLQILNHKGRVASDGYFVVNALAVVDCIDQAASVVEQDSLDPGAFSGCKQLVLREEVIPPELAVLRLQHWPAVVVIRRALADKLNAAGLTGLRFVEPGKYTGMT